MSFRSVFIALVIGFGLVLAGFLVNRQRPADETDQASAEHGPRNRQMRRVPHQPAICHRARIRTERPRRQGNQLPGVPSARRQTGAAWTITASSSPKR